MSYKPIGIVEARHYLLELGLFCEGQQSCSSCPFFFDDDLNVEKCELLRFVSCRQRQKQKVGNHES